MAEDLVNLEARPITLYSLRIIPLWEGEAECIALGDNLQGIIDRIVADRSVAGFLGNDIKPMRFCVIEKEEAIFLPRTQQTFYAREQMPVWKVMVPASGIYSRETIMSCVTRGAGRNTEKYQNVLFHHPRAESFYTFSSTEIRPVDASVFVIEHQAR